MPKGSATRRAVTRRRSWLAFCQGDQARMNQRHAILSAATAFGIVMAGAPAQARDPDTTTPIRHLVVIFQENISFDHYFGTYPMAENKPGETPFEAKGSTPK